MVSLAERGSATPARQRTVTEVVWPEHMAALNSGLRSRLNSSTSLFRAGSQKSVIDGNYGNYGLDRRESQRSVSEWQAKPLSIPSSQMKDSSMTSAASSVGSGWCSEQGSPRRPGSLVLSESMIPNQRDWLVKSVSATPDSPVDNKSADPGATPVNISPHVLNQRFSTTYVEISPEQVLESNCLFVFYRGHFFFLT